MFSWVPVASFFKYQKPLGGFKQCVKGQFSGTLLSEFQYLFSLTNFLNLWVLFLGQLPLMVQPWVSCSISFSALMPNVGNVPFFLILWYWLFHHKCKQNLLFGKYFYPSVSMTSGLLPHISWSICTEKFHSLFHLSFSITASGLCSYHFSFTSIPCFLYIPQWIFIPNQSCHLLYSSWANLLHSLNTYFTLSSAFPHILHLLFFFAFMLLILMACYCAAIHKASVVHFKLFFVVTIIITVILISTMVIFTVISHRAEILVTLVFAVRADTKQMLKVWQQYLFLGFYQDNAYVMLAVPINVDFWTCSEHELFSISRLSIYFSIFVITTCRGFFTPWDKSIPHWTWTQYFLVLGRTLNLSSNSS